MRKGSFKCDLCDFQFNEHWKSEGHVKTCEKNSCDKCDKTFNSKHILNKHIQVIHENVKLFCHYFNNDQTCPFNDDCVFLHEESGDCKYGESCEREFCMFQHKENNDSSYDDEEESENGDGDEESENENEEENVDNEEVNECDQTFVNPSLVRTQEQNKVSRIEVEEQPIQCELCIFKTPNKGRMQKHSIENHSVKGKYVCTLCKQEFNKKQFKNHKYHGCGGWSIEDFC